MARPTVRDDGVVRNQRSTVRFAPDELELLQNLAKLSNCSVASFIRTAAILEAEDLLAREGEEDEFVE